MGKIELLAPAGDLERLKVNLLYGADAVYLGGEKLGLRANATNFTLEELKEGCDFAHKLHKKVFITCNIVFHEEDRVEMEEYIASVVKAGVDAIIVSDLYLINYLVKNYPQVEVHVSTQDSITNVLEAMFYKELGVKRIVLARELSLKEIQEIIEKTHLPVEVFIHGAMCTCYSGRCALSSYVTNRDPNRGGCSQVCRFAFESGEKQKFTLATKDLNLAGYIEDLMRIGVTSFKIEGRMRSIYYLATVVGSYRKLIDAIESDTLTEALSEELEKKLARVANRETSTHYLLKEADMFDQYYTGRQELSNQDYIGLVTAYENGCLAFRLRNYLKQGEKVELFTANGKTCIFTVEKLLDEEKKPVFVANHPDKLYFIEEEIPFQVLEYTMIRKCVE